jgi:hypothetical protein
MQRRYSYKGFVIEAYPYELRDMAGWKAEFYIERHDESGIDITQFFMPDCVFPTEADAITAAIQSGGRKIDSGFVPQPSQKSLVDLASAGY